MLYVIGNGFSFVLKDIIYGERERERERERLYSCIQRSIMTYERESKPWPLYACVVLVPLVEKKNEEKLDGREMMKA